MSKIASKAVSILSATVQAQPETTGNTATTIALCRHVFDDLLDKDLLGFLLSSSHLQKYLAHFSTYAQPQFAELVRRNIMSAEIVANFHKYMLKMYAGIYIREAEIEDHIDLLAILDVKFQAFTRELEPCDVRYETSTKQLESVERAWKYRHACGAGRPISAFEVVSVCV